MKRIIAGVLTGVTIQMGIVSCFGGFGLTRKVYNFNTTVGSKWISWIAFLVLNIILVYGIAILVDVLILNSIEFWTGSRVVEADQYDENGEYSHEEIHGDEQAIFTYKHYGEVLHVDIFKNGEHAGNMILYKHQPGVFYSADETGAISRLQVEKKDMHGQVQITVKHGEKVLQTESMARMDYLKMTDRSRALAREVSVY